MEKSNELSFLTSNEKMQQWLKEVFKKEDLPSFDETPEFVQLLKTIMIENKAAEKDAKAIIKAEKRMKDFYFEKAGELKLVSDFIQLKFDTCQRVEKLSSLAEKMKLKEPSLTNFLLGMAEIEDKEQVKIDKEFVHSHHMSVFSRKITETMKMNEKLRRSLKPLAQVVEIQKTNASDIVNNLKYFEKKKEQVKRLVEENEKCLKEGGYLEELGIRHSVLVEKAQKLKDLEEHIRTLENKLLVYHELEPNLTETTASVEAKEKKLIELDEEIQRLLHVYENL